MRLYLINPSNPLVSFIKANESRWNQYRVWKPLGLLVRFEPSHQAFDTTLRVNDALLTGVERVAVTAQFYGDAGGR